MDGEPIYSIREQLSHHTATIADSLEDIHAYGHHMGPCTIGLDFVRYKLIGIAKIKGAFFHSDHWTDIQWGKKLIVQESVTDSSPIVVFKIPEAHFHIDICSRPTVALK